VTTLHFAGGTVILEDRLLPDGIYTGTKWRVHDRGDGKLQFECLGNLDDSRWLDGGAGIRLAPDSNPPGTFWKARKAE
jgi:hypothetical protein